MPHLQLISLTCWLLLIAGVWLASCNVWIIKKKCISSLYSRSLGNDTRIYCRGFTKAELPLLVNSSAYVDIKIPVNSNTCCLAVCWSIWCPCAGSCSYGSSPDPPLAGAWSCGRARGKTGRGPTPAVPSGRGPCTQTPGKRHLEPEGGRNQTI